MARVLVDEFLGDGGRWLGLGFLCRIRGGLILGGFLLRGRGLRGRIVRVARLCERHDRPHVGDRVQVAGLVVEHDRVGLHDGLGLPQARVAFVGRLRVVAVVVEPIGRDVDGLVLFQHRRHVDGLRVR